MPVSVVIDSALPEDEANAVRTALEAIDAPRYHWEVRLTPGAEAWNLTLSGPDQHRRVYRLPESGARARDPRYLGAIAGAEIRSFPSCPPFAFGFAVGELALRDIPYDDSDAFRGNVSVGATTMTVQKLIELYRSGDFPTDSLLEQSRGAQAPGANS